MIELTRAIYVALN